MGNFYIGNTLLGPGKANLNGTIVSLKPLERQIEIPELKIDWDHKPPQYLRSIDIPLSVEAEFTMEADINAPLFSKLTGADLTRLGNPNSFTMQYSSPYQEQVRRHKKKRINKKWAKRYGYRTKFKKFRISEVSFTGDGFEFEATGRNITIVK